MIFNLIRIALHTYISVMLLASIWMAAALVWAQSVSTFGTTVVIPFGLEGHLYLLKPGTAQLPNFDALEPVGSIYTSSLNIRPRAFSEGFPGVTGRFESFALDYRGRPCFAERRYPPHSRKLLPGPARSPRFGIARQRTPRPDLARLQRIRIQAAAESGRLAVWRTGRVGRSRSTRDQEITR